MNSLSMTTNPPPNGRSTRCMFNLGSDIDLTHTAVLFLNWLSRCRKPARCTFHWWEAGHCTDVCCTKGAGSVTFSESIKNMPNLLSIWLLYRLIPSVNRNREASTSHWRADVCCTKGAGSVTFSESIKNMPNLLSICSLELRYSPCL